MRNKGWIQGLYDMAAGAPDENGIPTLDEQKLRRELDRNDRLMRNNKDIFEEKEPKFRTCKRYNPCPICSKCMNKASHLYVACQTCQIPICSHTYSDREKMIKRKNFTQYVSKEIMNEILRIEKEVIDNA